MSIAASVMRSRNSALAGLTVAAAVVTAITLLLYPLSELDPGVSSGVLYVLGVLLVATQWGLWLGLVTSVNNIGVAQTGVSWQTRTQRFGPVAC